MTVLAVGKRPPHWVSAGYEEYASRLPKKEVSLRLIEITAELGKSRQAKEVKQAEAARMLATLDKTAKVAHVIALDERGKHWSTKDLAVKMDYWRQNYAEVGFLIGGAEGLDARCTARADEVISLSALTFPHALVRVILAEQLYRAWTVINGHPYHRAHSNMSQR